MFNNYKHLKPLVILILLRDKIIEITIGFESLHGIPYILGAIDHNQIPIVAPKVNKIILLSKRVLFHIDSRDCRCKVQFLRL
jgi:hypothetical protein